MYSLYKIVVIKQNSVDLISVLSEDDRISIKRTANFKYSIGAIVIYNSTTSRLTRYSSRFKGLLRQYTEKEKFTRLTKDSDYIEEYISLIKEKTYDEVYMHILRQEKDSTTIQKINNQFTKNFKAAFSIQLPLYTIQLKENLARYNDKYGLYYLASNRFYTYLTVNTLLEKPYTKFYNTFLVSKQLKIYDINIT